MLTPITCHTSSRWKVSTSSHPAAFVLFLKNISLRNFAHRMKKWASVLKKEVKKRKVCWMCKKNHILILNFVSSGVCAELPPGAFRDGGGFHSWGWSQRVFLPQSPDLTCRCVILQCLRWQRSLTIYGEIGCLFSPQLVNNSGIFFISSLQDWALNWKPYLQLALNVFELLTVWPLYICLWHSGGCVFFTGCDKPGVPGKKRLPCTSIRNHSSGEESFI